jgi:enoyl-CoA hydratase/carnithine racemase
MDAGTVDVTSEAPVRYEVVDEVATITMNRPDMLNAITLPMLQRLFELLRAADADPSVRAVVLTGAGRAFCAGADLGVLATVPDEERDLLVPWAEDGPAFLRSLRVPVIAAINGPAVGLGLALTLAADVRFIAADAKLALPFSRLGIYAEYGSAWLLPRLVGRGAALDLLLSGRTFLGTEAGTMGLAQQVLPAAEVLPAALAYARALAADCAPAALAAIRAMVDEAAAQSLDEHYAGSVLPMRTSMHGEDFREGVAARREKRTPRFAAHA